MEIINFTDKLRVGSHYPQALDVEPIEGHESYGIYATFYAYNTEGGLKRAELRYKENAYALFLFGYVDQELPRWWQDSNLIWSLTSEHDIDDRAS